MEPTYRRLFEAMPEPTWVVEAGSLRVLEVNRAATRHYGWPREVFVELTLTDLLVLPEVPRFLAVADDPSGWRGRWRHRGPAGAPIDVDVATEPVEFDGRPAVLVVAADVTERVRAEARLRASEAQYRSVVDNVKQVIFRTDARGVWTFLNAAWTEITGFTVEESLGTPFLRYVHPEDRQAHAEVFQPLLEQRGDYFGHVARYVTKAGGCRWIEVFAQLVFEPDGAVRGVFGTLTDITERKRAEEDLAASRAERARLSFVVEQSAEAIAITTPDGVVEYVNGACERLTGYARSEVVGHHALALAAATPDDNRVRELRETLGAGSAWSGRLPARRSDGTAYEVEAVVSPVRDAAGRVVNYVAGFHDVTRQRQIEDELRQAQKMEVAGRLAGGIAHDFNNLLTVITGRTHLLLRRLPADDPVRADLTLIEDTAQRATTLTRQLLVFSRKQRLAPRLIDLGRIVATMEKMLRRLIGEDVELVTRSADALGRVQADPGQIEQVIMNLVVNARDAMPLGGRLIVETANVELGAADPRRPVGLVPGPYVMLAVTDTGCGIAPETAAHIFEPFFTTKGPEHGTGLGLSTVYGIVKQSEGEIVLESMPGQGATFRIYLPRVGAHLEGPAGPAASAAPPRGSETVLLAEDEEEVRSLAREVLETNGYTVLEARHGNDALAVSRRYPGPIHVLMTDVVMPQMGGPELAERLRRERPETRTLFMSGYTDDTLVRHRAAALDIPVLDKPFSPDALARKVREVLEAPHAVASLPGSV